MFSKTARFYDRIYAFKDYRGEVERLTAIVREHLRGTCPRSTACSSTSPS